MKRLSKTATVVSVLVAMAFFSPGASAEWFENPRIVEHLGLTEEQVEQLEQKIEQFRDEQEEYRDEIRKHRRELRDMWKQDELDEEGILDKVRKVEKMEHENHVKRAEHRLEIAKILTPEQREEIRKVTQGRMRQRFLQGRAGRGQGAWGGQGRGMQNWGSAPGRGQGPHHRRGYGQGQPGFRQPGFGQPGMGQAQGRGGGYGGGYGRQAPPPPPPADWYDETYNDYGPGPGYGRGGQPWWE